MAGIYNGHLLEFPTIRIDNFLPPPPISKTPWLLPHPHPNHLSPPRPAPPARLFLLTHVHSDHLLGLSSDFTGHIVCSPDTKRMLLKLEAEIERGYVNDGVRERGVRKYEGLRKKYVGKGTKDERVIDRIQAVPIGVPTLFDLGYEDCQSNKVTITLLDANHCPGSTMFLITSKDKAVLHTGDIRADDLFLRTLRRNTTIGEFLTPSRGGKQRGRKLDRIYLDTSAFLGTGDMPEKESVITDLIDQMSLYPDDTVFFLNVWCFGWEDVVKEVSRHFGAPVHVDRYKSTIYHAVHTDPFLSECTTLDPYSTRFHACERRFKCEACRVFNKRGENVYNLDKRVVSVNMVEVKTAEWEIKRRDFLDRLSRAACGEGDWPFTIDCPIARHSPLPELQALVRLFRPHSLSPNTMLPEAQGMDYYLLPELFGDLLAEGGKAVLLEERDKWFAANPKFGQAYLSQMSSMAGLTGKMGRTPVVKVLDTNDGEETDTKHWRETNTGHGEEVGVKVEGPLGRGRRANKVDQIARLLSHSSSSSKNIEIFKNNKELAPNVHPYDFEAKATPIPTLPVRGNNGWLVRQNRTRTEEEYDTDDEEARRAFKRVRKRISEAKIELDLELVQAKAMITCSPSEMKPDLQKPVKAEAPLGLEEAIKVETKNDGLQQQPVKAEPTCINIKDEKIVRVESTLVKEEEEEITKIQQTARIALGSNGKRVRVLPTHGRQSNGQGSRRTGAWVDRDHLRSLAFTSVKTEIVD